MKRTQKEEVVTELEGKFRDAKVALVTTFKGLAVVEMDQLRSELRAVAGECRIAKNTLTKRALESTPYGSAADWLGGDTALVFGFEDPVAIAKIVARWSEAEGKKVQIKGGVVDGEVFSSEKVIALSKMLPKEELQAKFLALLQTPATSLVRLLSEPASSLARVLSAREKQQHQS
jgi:large subunit ribosomal protein L10